MPTSPVVSRRGPPTRPIDSPQSPTPASTGTSPLPCSAPCVRAPPVPSPDPSVRPSPFSPLRATGAGR
eukprot:3205074-Pleurochrysis_carterae.AAC.1